MISTTNLTLIDRINLRLDELKISRRAASVKAGLGPYYVRDILNGRSVNQQAEPLHRLAKALGVSLAWIISGEDDDTRARDIAVSAYIASGGMLVPFDKPYQELGRVDLPHDGTGVVGAATVHGPHLQPALYEGDLVFWGEYEPAAPSQRERLCMLADGRIMLRAALPGSRRDRFHLVGHNAVPINDVGLVGVARVLWVKRAA